MSQLYFRLEELTMENLIGAETGDITAIARDKRKLKETMSREANMRHLEINEKKNK